MGKLLFYAGPISLLIWVLSLNWPMKSGRREVLKEYSKRRDAIQCKNILVALLALPGGPRSFRKKVTGDAWTFSSSCVLLASTEDAAEAAASKRLQNRHMRKPLGPRCAKKTSVFWELFFVSRTFSELRKSAMMASYSSILHLSGKQHNVLMYVFSSLKKDTRWDICFSLLNWLVFASCLDTRASRVS